MRAALLALVPLGLSAYVFRPVLGSYFWADDFLNLYDIANVGALEYVLTPHVGHVLWLRNVLFYLFNLAFGVRAELFFTAALLTHLLNVLLFFVVLRRVTGSDLLAVFGASLWGTVPTHGEPLAWYAVYGQVVLATIWLWLLHEMSVADAAQRLPTRRRRVWWAFLALLGCTAFGIGLGLALALPIMVVIVFPALRARAVYRWPLSWLLVVVPVFYVVAHLLYVWVSGQSVPFVRQMLVFQRAVSPDPSGGDLSLASAAWLYLQTIPFLFWMLAQLLGYSFILLLRGWFTALLPSASIAVALWALAMVVLTAVAVRAGGATRRWLLLCPVLGMAVYASVAAGRAPLLRTMPLEYAAAAARYHYVGTIPAALAVCLLLAQLGTMVRMRPIWPALLFALWAGATVWAYRAVPEPVDQHRAARKQAAAALGQMRSLIKGAPPGATVLVPNRHFKPVGVLIDATEFPGWGAAFAIYFPSDTVEGRLVRFVTADPAVYESTRHGRRSAALFVRADSIAPPPAPLPAGDGAPSAAQDAGAGGHAR